MQGITVNQLAQMCLKMSAQGKGDKLVLMSSDDECNEYHQVWNGLQDGSKLKKYVDAYQLNGCVSQDIGDYIVLT
jgi:hypothetical protein